MGNGLTTGRTFGGKVLANDSPQAITVPVVSTTENDIIYKMPVHLRPLDGKDIWGKDRRMTKTDMFKEFPACLSSLAVCAEHATSFFATVVSENVEFRGFTPSFKDQLNIVNGFLGHAQASIPFYAPELSRARLALQPDTDVYEAMTAGIQAGASQILRSVMNALPSLVKNEVLGSVTWHSKDVCDYYGYRWIMEDETIKTSHHQKTNSYEGFNSVTHTTTLFTDKDIRRSLRHVMKETELMNAWRLQPRNRPSVSRELQSGFCARHPGWPPTLTWSVATESSGASWNASFIPRRDMKRARR